MGTIEREDDLQINKGVEARPPADANFPSGKRSVPIRDASLGEQKQHQGRLPMRNTHGIAKEGQVSGRNYCSSCWSVC